MTSDPVVWQELLSASLSVKPYLDGSHSVVSRYRNSAYMTPAQKLRQEANEIEAKDAAIERFANAIAKANSYE